MKTLSPIVTSLRAEFAEYAEIPASALNPTTKADAMDLAARYDEFQLAEIERTQDDECDAVRYAAEVISAWTESVLAARAARAAKAENEPAPVESPVTVPTVENETAPEDYSFYADYVFNKTAPKDKAELAAFKIKYLAHMDAAILEHGENCLAQREQATVFAIWEKGIETLPPAGIVLSSPPAPPVQDVVFDTVQDAPKAEKEQKIPSLYQSIKTALLCICQPTLIAEFATWIKDAREGKVALPPLFFSGYAGLGKTHAFGVFAALLPEFTVVEPKGKLTLGAFKKLLVDYCAEGSSYKILFFLDEMHDLEDKAATLLKEVTETNGKVKTFTVLIKEQEYAITIDPRRHAFIGASNEPISDPALVGQSGRFKDCQFKPYDESGMKALIEVLGRQYLPDVEFSSQSVTLLAKNCRPFARAITSMLRGFRVAINEGFNLEDKEQVKKALAFRGIYKGGWTERHIKVLMFIAATEKGRQVQEIAQGAMEGASSKQASEILAELLQGRFVITLANGRKAASVEGVAFLKSLEKKK